MAKCVDCSKELNTEETKNFFNEQYADLDWDDEEFSELCPDCLNARVRFYIQIGREAMESISTRKVNEGLESSPAIKKKQDRTLMVQAYFDGARTVRTVKPY